MMCFHVPLELYPMGYGPLFDVPDAGPKVTDVCSLSRLESAALDAKTWKTDCEQVLADFTKKVKAQNPKIHVTTKFAIGDPRFLITDQAKLLNSDAVVVGRFGKPGSATCRCRAAAHATDTAPYLAMARGSSRAWCWARSRSTWPTSTFQSPWKATTHSSSLPLQPGPPAGDCSGAA